MKIKGVVIKGKDKGKALGFPTANIKISGECESGVYGGRVILNGRQYQAGIYVTRDRKLLEAHLLNFSGDLLNKEIEVEVGSKIREARKFKDNEELKEQIKKDLNFIKNITRINHHISRLTRPISRLTQIYTQKNADNKDFLYGDVTYKIRGACFDVYKQFGGAFKEKIIESALVEELKSRGLKVEIQKRINIYYKDKKVGVYVPDIIVNDSILMELKCKPFITKEDERQFWLYLKGSNYRLGLLINFGSQKLEIKRRIYDMARRI